MTGQGKGLALKSDAAMTDVQQIQPVPVAPTTLELSRIMGEELGKVTGINEELMGSAIDDKAGVLAALRQGSGLTTLQSLFDHLDLSQRILGQIMVSLIVANFTVGKVKKILGGEEPTRQFHDKNFGVYHAQVEEGLNTQTQRQMQFAQMIQLKEMGLPISPADLMEAASFQNKDRIIKNMEQAEQQQQQMQQQKDQMEMQLQQAQIELAQARAKADIGLSLERTSRVQENRALSIQKLAEANSDNERANLDKIKAIKELEGLELGHLQALLNMVNSLKQQEVESSKGLEGDQNLLEPQGNVQ